MLKMMKSVGKYAQSWQSYPPTMVIRCYETQKPCYPSKSTQIDKSRHAHIIHRKLKKKTKTFLKKQNYMLEIEERVQIK